MTTYQNCWKHPLWRRLSTIKELVFKSINPLYKFSYKATVDTQIDVYTKLKLRKPSIEEGEILDELINSRIEVESMLPEFSSQNPRAFYSELLRDKEKTLGDVICSIVYFECVGSRKGSLKGVSPEDILAFMGKVQDYTNKQILMQF